MKSSIKIELVPIGKSLEPVIKVKIDYDTSDVRDYALKTFFDSQGYESNTLVVKRIGGFTSPDGSFKELEIYPVSNLLVERWPEGSLSGIRIATNSEEIRIFLDQQKVTYTNDGENITVFNVQELFKMGVDFERFWNTRPITN